MAIWLYSAADSKADAERTLELAEKHGIVWRTFCAHRSPVQSIPNVKQLRPDDVLYLGFRDGGHTHLLARMRLGRPDAPLPCSAVFTRVPAQLLEEFAAAGYGPDPVLGFTIGLLVTELEPVDGVVPSGSRNALRWLESDPELAPQPVRTRASDSTLRHLNVADGGRSPVRGATTRGAITPAGWFAGIDVGGAQSKGFDICRLRWSQGRPTKAEFLRCRHRTALPPQAVLHDLAKAGDLARLAAETYPAARDAAADLWHALASDEHVPPSGVFIDSPSGFSRNARGHGRRTEKSRLIGVSFQSTPSVACGRGHRGTWAWIVYGMAAFASCRLQGSDLLLEGWLEYLHGGVTASGRSPRALILREVFPTATVSALRSSGRAAETAAVLASLADCTPDEVHVVEEYLNLGVSAVKRRGSLYDRADALVAALSSLPFASSGWDEALLEPAAGARWNASDADGLREGTITVVR